MRKWLLGVVIVALPFAASAMAAETPAVWMSAGRTGDADSSIDDAWRFIRQDIPAARDTAFDDSAWQPVTLPHTWNNLDGQDGGADYYRGPGWYRRHLNIPAADGQRRFLRFEGASLKTEVFVNGKSVGTHNNGFGAFCFEITQDVKPGDTVAAVRVDNTKFPDVPPLAGDFTVFGGLYRDVHLLTLNNLCISPIDDASPGVYLKQSKVSDDSADIQVTTKLLNGAASERQAIVACTITDAAGKTVATANAPQAIAPSGEARIAQ